jgi:hypothetical protein
MNGLHMGGGLGPAVCFDASGSLAPEVELKSVITALKAATDEARRSADTTNAELKNLGKVNEETKANADKALTEMGTLTTRLTDIEQKMARRGGPVRGAAEDLRPAHHRERRGQVAPPRRRQEGDRELPD